jgi:hypothetical protein
MITTETGMHPDVKALVYVAAAQPDVDKHVGTRRDDMVVVPRHPEFVAHIAALRPGVSSL